MNLTKKQMQHIIEQTHAQLDALMVARGDAHGAYSLMRRVQELAETVTPERADMAREAHRRMHGEE